MGAASASAALRRPSVIPMGRRTPKGALRWYALSVPEGREAETCRIVRACVPASILKDIFCMGKERWLKRQGTWFTTVAPAYKGYAFALTDDAAALYKELSHLTVPVTLVGGEGRRWMPLSPEAEEWYARMMDGAHVLRSSTGELVDGRLHVVSGPLMGQEVHIRDLDRHHRRCMVDIPGTDGGFSELMPIAVPGIR